MDRPTRPTLQTRAIALAVRFSTGPKGDCKVTGNEERNQLQFYKRNPLKNRRTKNEKLRIRLAFYI